VHAPRIIYCRPDESVVGHKDDIARHYAASLGVTPESARRLDTDIVLPRSEEARGSSPDWKNDYFGCFHGTHTVPLVAREVTLWLLLESTVFRIDTAGQKRRLPFPTVRTIRVTARLAGEAVLRIGLMQQNRLRRTQHPQLPIGRADVGLCRGERQAGGSPHLTQF
jgi:hypothetical protein